MSTLDRVSPDVVMPAQQPAESPDPLNPCPNCGSVPNMAPEGVYLPHHTVVKAGVKAVGDAIWEAEHCWKCGFRPGVNQAVSLDAMKRQFDAYKAWVNDQLAAESDKKGLGPPPDSEVETLKAQIEQMKKDMAEANLKGTEG